MVSSRVRVRVMVWFSILVIEIWVFSQYYYAALLPRRGPHIASHSVCLSVCLSVRPSRSSRYGASLGAT